ncbi:MAG: UDP-glucose 4-epimerase GalE [Pseudomonadota bacterium]
MPSVLVVGGAGYIGSHTCKALAAEGFVPVVYDDLSAGHEWAVKWGPLEVGDIADRKRLNAVLRAHTPVAAIHLGASIQVGESVRAPDKYYRNNVAGTLVLLGALKDAGVDALVFSSTAAVYGEPETVPIPDDAAKAPINPYGRSKWMVEQILTDFGVFGLKSIALRYFNAAGADPDGEIGEAHDPESHLIPRILMAAAGDIPHIDIYGSDYPTPDGTAIRDYVHVADLADAHVKALKCLRSGSQSSAYNLGTGDGTSVREIIAATERVTGKTVPVRTIERRTGDPPRLVADPSRARSEIGLATPRSDASTIVETAWRWYREGAPANGFRLKELQ